MEYSFPGHFDWLMNSLPLPLVRFLKDFLLKILTQRVKQSFHHFQWKHDFPSNLSIFSRPDSIRSKNFPVPVLQRRAVSRYRRWECRVSSHLRYTDNYLRKSIYLIYETQFSASVVEPSTGDLLFSGLHLSGKEFTLVDSFFLQIKNCTLSKTSR